MQQILAIMCMLLLTFPLCLEAFCSPPPSVQCKSNGKECEIFNYQGIWEDRSICRAAEAASPKTEAEILHAVARAVENKQKIKVVSTLAHSISKLVCVGDHGLIISTENYASVIGINKTAMTITVQGGAMMRDVIEEAAKEGLALPAMIYWNGVSAAGVVSTGAHGSGLMGRGSGVYEYVVGMRMVVPASPSEGYAKLITLTEADHDEELRGARLSLGTLGVISELTFVLQPMFKRSLSRPILKDEKWLDNEISRFLRDHEFADVIWLPFHRLVVFRRIDRVPIDAPGDGLNIGIGIPSRAVDIENFDPLGVQATEDYVGLCAFVGEQIIAFVANGSGGGFWNDGIKGFTGYPVTGFNHRMQTSGGCQGNYLQLHQHDTSGCTSNQILDKNQTVCPWDRRVTTSSFHFDMELRVPMSRLPETIKDIKKIRDLNPESMCESYVVFRSIKKSDAYLGPAEDVVTLELFYHRPREANTPKLNEDVYEEMEQMVIEKHGGTMHWGKSGGYLFGGLAKRAANLVRFLQVKNRYDPEGLFSNEWTDGLLGIGEKGAEEVMCTEYDPEGAFSNDWPDGLFLEIGEKGVEELRDGCALDKMCKCREDKHCAPEKGYFCRPGRVWKQARVCRKLD